MSASPPLTPPPAPVPRLPLSPSPTRAVGAALLGLGGFAVLAALWTRLPAWRRLDAAVLDRIRACTPDALLPGAEIITHLGSLPVTIPLALALAAVLMYRHHRRTAGLWLVTFFGGQAVLFGFKLLFDRMRPRAPGYLLPDTSFPSGHAFTAVLLYGALAYGGAPRLPTRWARRVLRAGLIGLILAIGWSRLVLRVHYPTDVLGGYALGIAWLALLGYTRRRLATSQPPLSSCLKNG